MNINKAVLKFVKLGITLVVTLLIFYATVSISLVGFDFGYRVFTEPAMEEEPGRDVIFTVEPGDSVEEIAANLKKEGLIRDASLFVWQERVSAYYGDEKAGTYTLNTSQTVGEMLAILAGEASSTEEE